MERNGKEEEEEEEEEIELEIKKTNQRLQELWMKLNQIKSSNSTKQPDQVNHQNFKSNLPMPLDDYTRFGRQMILSEIGLKGKSIKLKNSSIMVIGAGGLGCPALLYLARAGVGRIAIVDHDIVELSNLHRQVLHTNLTVGMNKAESAKLGILAGTSSEMKIDVYPIRFSLESLSTQSNQRIIPTDFSIILDCTDNSETRYLISDVCSATGIPLISGAAIRTEGQLSIWNLPINDHQRGPCYRCIFPVPIESRLEQRCEDEGVLGPIVGLVGVLMALESIRFLIGTHDHVPKLLLIPSFRTIKLRQAQANCSGCSPESQLAFRNQLSNSISSTQHPKTCGKSVLPEGTVPCFERISSDDLRKGKKKLDEFVIVDVRPRSEYSICSLPNSINIPIDELLRNPKLIEIHEKSILFVCRRGNDSQLVAQSIKAHHSIYDLEGGLVAYSQFVDPTFPRY
ncbi:molybdopterin synthase sulfurylase [Melampsora americana]|nr:molybdopterin synthase sulfurylase [Melampsora americana]